MPVVGNAYILSAPVARAFNAGKVPGCVVTDALLAVVEREATAPTRAARSSSSSPPGSWSSAAASASPGSTSPATVTRARSPGSSRWRTPTRRTTGARSSRTCQLGPAGRLRAVRERRRRALHRRAHPAWASTLTPAGPGPRAPRRATLLQGQPRPPRARLRAGHARLPGVGAGLRDHRAVRPRASRSTSWSRRSSCRCSTAATAATAACRTSPTCAPRATARRTSATVPAAGAYDGQCEVPGHTCVWADAYRRLKPYGEERTMLERPMVVQDNDLRRTSAWANTFLGRDHFATDQQSRPPAAGRAPQAGRPAGRSAPPSPPAPRKDPAHEARSKRHAVPRRRREHPRDPDPQACRQARRGAAGRFLRHRVRRARTGPAWCCRSTRASSPGVTSRPGQDQAHRRARSAGASRVAPRRDRGGLHPGPRGHRQERHRCRLARPQRGRGRRRLRDADPGHGLARRRPSRRPRRVPVSIDSSDVAVLAAGVAASTQPRGRLLLNSASIERPEVLDIAADAACAVILAASGVGGMPANAEERVANAMRAHRGGGRARHPRRTCSTSTRSCCPSRSRPTPRSHVLEAARQLRAEYGDAIHLTGGLSNVSFGMPARKLLNDTFIDLCAEAGIDSGIIDPVASDLAARLRRRPRQRGLQAGRGHAARARPVRRRVRAGLPRGTAGRRVALRGRVAAAGCRAASRIDDAGAWRRAPCAACSSGIGILTLGLLSPACSASGATGGTLDGTRWPRTDLRRQRHRDQRSPRRGRRRPVRRRQGVGLRGCNVVPRHRPPSSARPSPVGPARDHDEGLRAGRHRAVETAYLAEPRARRQRSPRRPTPSRSTPPCRTRRRYPARSRPGATGPRNRPPGRRRRRCPLRPPGSPSRHRRPSSSRAARPAAGRACRRPSRRR